jgi:bifunctional DNase/RNase
MEHKGEMTPDPANSDLTDAVLVKRARGGDRRAFTELLLRYRGSVLGMCRRLLSGSPEADDVVQEASLQAFLGIERLADPASFGPWLHAIAANLARKLMRARRTTPISSVFDHDEHKVLGRRELALRLSAGEGEAVEAAMAGPAPPYPATHDLLLRCVEAVGGRIQRVVVDRLAEETFCATVELARQRQTRSVDARVADGVVLALLRNVPVFMIRSLFDQLAWDPTDPRQRRRAAERHRKELAERLRAREAIHEPGSNPAQAPALAAGRGRDRSSAGAPR